MNRKPSTRSGPKQGWQTLDVQQLRKVEGGTEEVTLGYTEVEWTYNRARSTPKLLESAIKGKVFP